jgi:predicted ribosomally synthesized peptide with nif11-like leader
LADKNGMRRVPLFHLLQKNGTNMAIKDIKAFADKARTDAELKEKLIACQKVRELLTLAKDSGFNFIEDEMYPPNEPQFTADQLSEKLAKALLRA